MATYENGGFLPPNPFVVVDGQVVERLIVFAPSAAKTAGNADGAGKRKTLDEYAAAASFACARWYGRVDFSGRNNTPPQSCADYFKEHWRRFPRTSPDAHITIDNDPGGLIEGGA